MVAERFLAGLSRAAGSGQSSQDLRKQRVEELHSPFLVNDTT